MPSTESCQEAEEDVATDIDQNPIRDKLVRAACNGRTEAVKSLLREGLEKEGLLSEIGDALYYAVLNGHTDVVKCLMEAGMRSAVLVEKLVKKMEDVLLQAALSGYIEIVKYMIEVGMENANLRENIRSSTGSALIEASALEHTNVVKYLVKAGMKDGKFIRELSDAAGHALVDSVINEHTEIVMCLLEAGMDNKDMMRGLLGGMEQLKEFGVLPGDERAAALFSRVEMKATHNVSYHVVLLSATGDPCAACGEHLHSGMRAHVPQGLHREVPGWRIRRTMRYVREPDRSEQVSVDPGRSSRA